MLPFCCWCCLPVQLLPFITKIRPGFICHSRLAAFRIPQDKFATLRTLILEVLNAQRVTAPTLEKIARNCMSMRVAVQPTFLWTHFM